MSNLNNIDYSQTEYPIFNSTPSHNFGINNVVDDVNDEMNLHLSVTTIVSLKAKKSDTIRDLKQNWYRQGISENLFDVILAGNPVDDNLTLRDCGTEDNSTLDIVLNGSSLAARRLYIAIPSQQVSKMMVVVSVNDTINHLKAIVATKAGLSINLEDFDMMFNGMFLDPNETISSSNLQTNTLLYLIEHPKQVILVATSNPTGYVSLKVRPIQTIGCCKTMLATMTNIEVGHGVLVFNGEPLEDSHTLASYNVPDKAVMVLVYKFQVYVKLWSGKIMTLDVLPTDDVDAVNRKLSATMKVPALGFPLFYHGVRIEPGRDLESYGVQMNSIIAVGHPAES